MHKPKIYFWPYGSKKTETVKIFYPIGDIDVEYKKFENEEIVKISFKLSKEDLVEITQKYLSNSAHYSFCFRKADVIYRTININGWGTREDVFEIWSYDMPETLNLYENNKH